MGKRGDVGPSIAETMIQQGLSLEANQTIKSRINGKLEVHKRLRVKMKNQVLEYLKPVKI